MTVTHSFWFFSCFSEDGFISATYYPFHVWHAGIADLNSVLVKDFMQLVVWWETFLDQVKEFTADVGFHIFAIWGVEP